MAADTGNPQSFSPYGRSAKPLLAGNDRLFPLGIVTRTVLLERSSDQEFVTVIPRLHEGNECQRISWITSCGVFGLLNDWELGKDIHYRAE
jgi:hypothetical protein